MDGVKDIHVTEGVPVCFPYEPEGFSDLWIRNYIERTPYLSAEEVIADYQADPSRYYGMLKGIDEEEFDYLNQSLDTPVDKQDFLDGKTGIVKYDGSEYQKNVSISWFLSVIRINPAQLRLGRCPTNPITAEETQALR